MENPSIVMFTDQLKFLRGIVVGKKVDIPISRIQYYLHSLCHLSSLPTPLDRSLIKASSQYLPLGVKIYMAFQHTRFIPDTNYYVSV